MMTSGRGPVLILLRLVKWKAAYSASLCEGYCWSGSEWSLFLGFLLEGSVLVIRHAIFENKLLNWNDILTLKVDVASLITASVLSPRCHYRVSLSFNVTRIEDKR